MTVRAPLVALLLAAVAARAAAQTASRLSADGIAAYRGLAYDSAAALLRRSLEGQALPHTLRVESYIYLGAAEWLRGRSDAARAAFRDAVRVDTRARVDTLIFPPEVTAEFDSVRRATAYVAVVAPADTTIVPGRGEVPFRLYAASPQFIVVEVIRPGAGPIAHLYAGAFADSLHLSWDGLDSSAARPGDGVLRLTVTARAGGGEQRVFNVPLEVRSLQVDTEPYPPAPGPPSVVPGSGTHPGIGPLVLGLAAGALAAALPSVVSPSARGMPARFFLAGTLSLSGLIASVLRRGGTDPAAADAAADQAAQAAWQAQRSRIAAENQRRLQQAGFEIRAGAVTGDGASP